MRRRVLSCCHCLHLPGGPLTSVLLKSLADTEIACRFPSFRHSSLLTKTRFAVEEVNTQFCCCCCCLLQFPGSCGQVKQLSQRDVSRKSTGRGLQESLSLGKNGQTQLETPSAFFPFIFFLPDPQTLCLERQRLSRDHKDKS